MSSSNLKLVPAPDACGCTLRHFCDLHVQEIADEPCTCTVIFDGFEATDSGCASCDARAQIESDIPY